MWSVEPASAEIHFSNEIITGRLGHGGNFRQPPKNGQIDLFQRIAKSGRESRLGRDEGGSGGAQNTVFHATRARQPPGLDFEAPDARYFTGLVRSSGQDYVFYHGQGGPSNRDPEIRSKHTSFTTGRVARNSSAGQKRLKMGLDES